MLRIAIDGQWEPADFIEVLTAVESLYYKAALQRRPWLDRHYFWFEGPSGARSFDEYIAASNAWLLASARATARPIERLRVSRIRYASPGGFDLVGLGEASKAVREVVDSLIKFFTEKELRRQAAAQAMIDTQIKETERDKQNQSLIALKIENARNILALRRDYPEVPDDLLIGMLVDDQDKLIPRIAEGKLVAVQTIDKDTHDEGGTL